MKPNDGNSPQFHGLDQDKKGRLQSLYDQLDVDQNGKIDISELVAALKKRMPNIAETADYANQIMQRADTSLDQGIDFNEFVTYVLEHEKRLALTFKDLDWNKDGILDYHEVKKNLQELGMQDVTDDQAHQIIKKMTSTSDGEHSIGLDEFQQFFVLHPSSSAADIVDFWKRDLFFDVGDHAAIVPDVGNKSAWWKNLLAGGVAGAVSRTATAPLDRLKIFLQVRASRQNDFRLLNSFQYLLKEGGLKALWRGNGVSVTKIVPESAIKFWAYEQAKGLIARNNATGQLSGGERFLAGSAAGVVSQTAVYPMEVLKTRLALRKTGEMNRGMLDAFRTVYRTDGLRAFGRGYLPNLIGIMPYAGTEMAVYETLKNICILHYTDHAPSLFVLFGCSIASSSIAQLVSYPLALVRTRLQANAVDQPNTMLGQFNHIVRHDGVFGLYRGLVPNFLRVLPSVGISYVMYEVVQKWLGTTMR